MPDTASACRHCGRPVLWARLNTGRWTPLDPAPDGRGQLVLLDGGRCHPVEPGARYGADVQARRHWDHLSTCSLGARVRTVATVAREVSAEAAVNRLRVRRLRLALTPAAPAAPAAPAGRR